MSRINHVSSVLAPNGDGVKTGHLEPASTLMRHDVHLPDHLGQYARHPEFRSWWAHDGCFRGISPVFAGFRDRRTPESVGTRFGWSG